jgi:glycosyltransferase involved in cell wall biosynthesis
VTSKAARPKVVALVPAWNASAFIVDTLVALAAQTYPNLEILISDDASPDDTADVCERYAATDSRFRVIRQPRNLGWAGNVNALLRGARGDYLVFAFQDDLFDPTYVERCVTVLEANPHAVIAFSDITLVSQSARRVPVAKHLWLADGSEERIAFTALDGVADRLERAGIMARLPSVWWTPNRGVFRAFAATEIGGLRRHLAGEFSADWPWLLHMALLGEFVRIPECLCTKIFQPRGLSQSWTYSRRAWIAVAISSAQAVARANIPLSEKFLLLKVPVAFVGRRVRRTGRRTLGRWPGSS